MSASDKLAELLRGAELGGGEERLRRQHEAGKLTDQLFKHPLTDIGLEKFLKDWEKSQAVAR